MRPRRRSLPPVSENPVGEVEVAGGVGRATEVSQWGSGLMSPLLRL